MTFQFNERTNTKDRLWSFVVLFSSLSFKIPQFCRCRCQTNSSRNKLREKIQIVFGEAMQACQSSLRGVRGTEIVTSSVPVVKIPNSWNHVMSWSINSGSRNCRKNHTGCQNIKASTRWRLTVQHRNSKASFTQTWIAFDYAFITPPMHAKAAFDSDRNRIQTVSNRIETVEPVSLIYFLFLNRK